MKKEHGSLKSYIIGFVLSIVLTLIAFYFVMQHDTSHHMMYSHAFLIILIVTLAFIQMLVQLFFFLHLGKKGQSPMNLLILISFLSIIIIVIVASIWIMQHLNYNMSLIRLDRVMKNGEGFQQLIKAYYYLTKPGIIYGNALTAIGGFFLASKGHIDFFLFLPMLFGLSFIIASACVFNNYIDRDIDKVMKRTKKRALATGKISERNAIIFAIILGLLGSLLLGFFTNLLTLSVALLGFFFYVIVYTYSKRQTKYGTLIGSISGATPPVVGYCAVTGHLDMGALLLFLILVVWQMPHFYAIAIFRSEEYSEAKIPVLPLKQGIFQTKIHMLVYILAFAVIVSLLSFFHYAGIVYLFVMGGLCLSWVTTSLVGFQTKNQNKWARKMFFLSLIIITVFSLMISLNSFLP